MTSAYIKDSAVSRIDHEFGALILQSATHKSPRFLPVQMLSRIISTGSIDWSSAAICACMNANIPIVLTSNSGETLGYISPVAHRRTQTLSALNHRLQHIPSAADFCAWTSARERVAILRQLSNKYWSLSDMRSDYCWKRLSVNLEQNFPGQIVQNIDSHAHGLVKAWLYLELTACGLNRAVISSPVARQHTLIDALALSALWLLRGRYHHWLLTANSEFSLEYAFEKMKNRLHRHLRKELNSLMRWVDEVYESHGH